jgi:hypothetical protein
MRPYYDESIPYEQYRPAYRYGWEARAERTNCSFEDIEAELKKKWESTKSKPPWDKARLATRDAWDRIEENFPEHARGSATKAR